MSAAWRAMFATLCFAVCANAQTLAVYHNSVPHIDSTTTHELQTEVQRLMASAGIEVAWRTMGERNDAEEFERVAVAAFDGNCSVAEFPSTLATPDTTGILADTAVSRERQVQPFLRVHCAQVIQTMRPVLERLSVPMRDVVLGRALARVIAHEIYHIVAETTDHAGSGVAKESFSLEDLVTERFAFDVSSIQRMHRTPLFAVGTVNWTNPASQIRNPKP